MQCYAGRRLNPHSYALLPAAVRHAYAEESSAVRLVSQRMQMLWQYLGGDTALLTTVGLGRHALAVCTVAICEDEEGTLMSHKQERQGHRQKRRKSVIPSEQQ